MAFLLLKVISVTRNLSRPITQKTQYISHIQLIVKGTMHDIVMTDYGHESKDIFCHKSSQFITHWQYISNGTS